MHKTNAPWLNIVGVPEAGIGALAPALQRLVSGAQTIIAPKRFLAGLPKTEGQTHAPWHPPLENMLQQVKDLRGQETLILATGDPNWFGIGATLGRHLQPAEFALHPAPSAFQLAGARLHWPLHNITTISLHGRAIENLHRHVLPANRILALTSNAATLPAIGALLVARGYGRSILTVLENLGASDERIFSIPAEEASEHRVGDFYTLAIDCVAGADADLLPNVPGLPDEAFANDGQLTKRHIRAATLAALAPTPGALLWDVGAGCGSVAIEWMRAAPDAKAIGFERDKSRCQLIAKNASALGVPGLEIINAPAPACLVDQPGPDAVFIGGAVADEAIFQACWLALRPGGRLVANAVSLAGQGALIARQQSLGGTLATIAVSTLGNLGGQKAFRPHLPVTQWAIRKPLS